MVPSPKNIGTPFSDSPSFTQAPSYAYMKNAENIAKNQGVESFLFLTKDAGFLPPHSFPALPPPYNIWEETALRIAYYVRSGSYKSILPQNFPKLPATAQHLPSEHLPRANLCLGAIAHAISHIAKSPLPSSIQNPWAVVASRLQKPSMSIDVYDLHINNFVLQSPHFSTASVNSIRHDSRPYLSLTGTKTELNFWHGCFIFEHDTRTLPHLLSTCQQAVHDRHLHTIRNSLLDIISVIDNMSDSFIAMDAREYSDAAVGYSEFNITVDPAVRAIHEGQNTASGNQSPAIHLLDAFFHRENFKSRFGTMIKKSRRTFAPLHLDFIDSIHSFDILPELRRLPKSPIKEELLSLYCQALDLYAGDYGFLAIHAMKLYGTVAMGTKMFRVKNSTGTTTTEWKDKTQYVIYDMMHRARIERTVPIKSSYITVKVQVDPLFAGSDLLGHKVIFQAPHKLCYSPGDVISVLPLNDEFRVNEVIADLFPDHGGAVTVQNKQWIQAISDWNAESLTFQDGTHATANIMLKTMLKMTDLNLLYENGDLIDSASSLENVLVPLSPRFFSIGSCPQKTPSSIEAFIGNLGCSTKAQKLSAKLTSRHIFGVCSSFIRTVDSNQTVRVRVVPEHRFRLPKNKNEPIIMFALGRGLMPFISFLRSLTPGSNTWLIIGVRSTEHVLYKEELENALKDRRLTKISVICSREPEMICFDKCTSSLKTVPGKKRRLHDFFEDPDEGPPVCKLLWDMVQANGHVYCCGSPALGPSVQKILSHAALSFGREFLQKAFRDSKQSSIRDLSRRFPLILAGQHRLHESLFGFRKDVIDKVEDNGIQCNEPLYTLSDVALHADHSSAYTILNNEVYDITNYLQIHPGGARILLDMAGRDMTEAFNNVHGGAKRAEFEATLHAYRIGSLFSYENSSKRMRKLENSWGTEVLHGLLECRSWLLLNINSYPSLENRVGFDDFKTQDCTPKGKALIMKRFVQSVEPEMFRKIEMFLKPAKIKELIGKNFLEQENLEHLAQLVLAARSKTWLSGKSRDSKDFIDVEKLIHQAKQLVDEVIEVAIAVQKSFEEALYKTKCEIDEVLLLPSVLESASTQVSTGLIKSYTKIFSADDILDAMNRFIDQSQ